MPTSKLRQIAIQVINGIVPLSSEELAAERQKVCDGCEHHAHLANQCRLCWCFMDLKTKILEAECPAGKW
jgi:hypothetical protein